MTTEPKKPRIYTRREDYTPMMIKVSNLDITLDYFKEKISNRVSVAKSGDSFCIFTSSKYWQEQTKSIFPNATVELAPSAQEVYHESLKIYAALNWKKFKTLNKEYVADSNKEVFVIVRSTSGESRDDEIATRYAKTIVPIIYTPSEGHQLIVIIRGWLRDAFQKLRDDAEFVDSKGHKVDNFRYFMNKQPIVRPTDKAIVFKLFAKISDVDEIIRKLQTLERYPQVQFLDPTTMDDRRKTQNSVERSKQREYRTNRRRNDRVYNTDAQEPRTTQDGEKRQFNRQPRNENRQPREDNKPRYENKPRSDDRPREDNRSNQRNAPRPAHERRELTAEKPQAQPAKNTIEIGKPESKVTIARFILNYIPDSMETDQLAESLSKAVGGDVRVSKRGGDIVCTVPSQFNDKLVSVLDRLKINGTQITYQRY